MTFTRELSRNPPESGGDIRNCGHAGETTAETFQLQPLFTVLYSTTKTRQQSKPKKDSACVLLSGAFFISNDTVWCFFKKEKTNYRRVSNGISCLQLSVWASASCAASFRMCRLNISAFSWMRYECFGQIHPLLMPFHQKPA